MSDEPKSNINSSSAEPTAARSHLPMWILLLTLALLYGGGIYFNGHSGWFDRQVYSPYMNAAELEAYQPKSGAAQAAAQGKKVYEQYCGLCHGTDGLGKPGQSPPLAGSEWVNAKNFVRLAHIPLQGLTGSIEVKGQEMVFPNGMVAIGEALSDADLANVLTYIRSSWGNQAGQVNAEDIKPVRADANGKPAINGEVQLKAIPE